MKLLSSRMKPVIGRLCAVVAAASVLGDASTLRAQEAMELRRPGPRLTVAGQGQAFAAPDSATLRLGAVGEASEASAAQNEVNGIVQRALTALRKLKLPENKIKTVGLSLTPVYEQQDRTHGSTRPRIVGYRAHNTLQVELEDLKLVGRAIDAGVQAGANNIEGLTFQLKEDEAARKEALKKAIQEARSKADVIAEAMDVRITGVQEVIEGGVQVMPPRPEFAAARMALAAEHATPVEPGEVRVDASVTIHYGISGGDKERH